jgi:16S rRNA (uracil1498-N3)-methyltransferase
VSAPLFFVDPGTLDGVEPGAEIELGGSEGRHAAQVRRLRVGERVDVADGAGARAECVVRRVLIGPHSREAGLTLEVVARADGERPALRFVLVQALAKGDRDLSALETATELGVDEVVPWQAERSVVVWRGDRGGKSRSRWAATAFAAAKQSRRTVLPQVSEVVSTDQLCARVRSGGATALVLDEGADRPLTAVDLPDAGDVLVVVGPEGGVSRGELDRLVAAGALVVRLGPTVLRSSSAGPAALAVLSARSRWT